MTSESSPYGLNSCNLPRFTYPYLVIIAKLSGLVKGFARQISLGRHTPLRTHSYVLVELSALVQARLGMEAVRLLHDDVMPLNICALC